jgi:molybdopterin-containing oxidoreductase family iron-sulfur binding subunit
MIERRRGFLKKIGFAAAGIGCGFPLIPVLASEELEHHKKTSANQLGMIIDIKKCLRKEVQDACVKACNYEHNLPDDKECAPERKFQWIWTEQYDHVFPDQTHEHFSDEYKGKPVIVLCNHCSTPACVKVCPTGATWKREQDGIVMMDMHRCIGCRYCMAACPYRSRSFNWHDPRTHMKKDARPEYPTRTKGVVEKCTFCAERLRLGLEPACVEASRKVPGGEGALTFGSITDPNSDVYRILKETHTIYRLGGLGTAPNIYYIV